MRKYAPLGDQELSSLPARDEILRTLSQEDPLILIPVLRLLCPCRNLCYDQEIWSAMVQIASSHPEWEVREQALHALVALRERSRIDSRAVELLLWLSEHGYGENVHPRWLRQELERTGQSGGSVRYPKVSQRDVPVLLEALASDDPGEQRHALKALCPGRTYRYNKKVWAAIFHSQESLDPVIRSYAQRAVPRLLEYARTDPEAAALVGKL